MNWMLAPVVSLIMWAIIYLIIGPMGMAIVVGVAMAAMLGAISYVGVSSLTGEKQNDRHDGSTLVR